MNAAAEIEWRSVEKRQIRIRVYSELEDRNGHDLHLAVEFYFRTRAGLSGNGELKARNEGLHAGICARRQNRGIHRRRIAGGHGRHSAKNLVSGSARRIFILNAKNRGRGRYQACDIGSRERTFRGENRSSICRQLLHSRLGAVKGFLTVLVIAAQALVRHYHPGHTHYDGRHQDQHQHHGDQGNSLVSVSSHG